MIIKKNKLIAIVGPTASGKTGIGVRVAKDFNGEIISADSRQIFRGLDLGTGKEGTSCREIFNFQLSTFNEYLKDKYSDDQINEKWKLVNDELRCNLRCIDSVPQWLIDIKEPGEDFHLFEFLELAKSAIEDIQSRGKVPVIVGGTGLYIQGLVEGFQLVESQTRVPDGQESKVESDRQVILNSFQDLNQNSKNNINHKRTELESLTREELQEILQELDPEAFEKVDKDNPHRLIRAIERAQEGTEMIKVRPDYQVLQIGINWPREVLYERIDKRVDDRFEQGMLEEVIGLLSQGVNPDWLMKLGLEYREITRFIMNNELRIKNYEKTQDKLDLGLATRHPELVSGSLSIEELKNSGEFLEMAQVLKYKIHQFAKRQCTWFNRFSEIVWENNYERINERVRHFLNL